MGSISKVLRILIAIQFGIGAVALMFVFSKLGGFSNTEKTLTILGFVLVVIIFMYNLACLIKDENIILEAILSGNGISFKTIGKLFFNIPKGIFWVICGIGFLIYLPFRKLHKIFRYGIGHKIRIKREKKEKPQKETSNEDLLKIIEFQNKYNMEHDGWISQDEAEELFYAQQKTIKKEEEKNKQQAEEEKKKTEKAQQKQQKKDIQEFREEIKKQQEDIKKREEEEIQEAQEREEKKNKLKEELKEKSTKLEQKLTIDQKTTANKLKKDIYWNVRDYITSISLAEAEAKVGLQYSDGLDNLRKFIVTYWHNSGVFDVQAALMFDRKTRKFIGSKRFSYVNTDYSQNTDEDTIKQKAMLAYYIRYAEEKGALEIKLKNDNYNYVKRILETKSYNFSENDKKTFNDLYAKFKKADETYENSDNKYGRVDNLPALVEARKNINAFAKEVRKQVLSKIKDEFNSTLKSTNKETTQYALIEACSELGYDPKEIAKIIGVDYLDDNETK